MNPAPFLAGAARIDITPPLGTLINGDLITHYARSIHDALYAKALVMQSGGQTIAIVVVDICAMPTDFLEEVKKSIHQQTGILPNNILISSTHTHAAGSIMSLLMGAADLPYRQKLAGLIPKVVQRAIQQVRPAKVGFGSVDVPEHVVCRRFFMKDGYEAVNPVTGGLDDVKTNPFGAEAYIDRRASTVDPAVGFLAVRGLDDQWISLLANYSLHYVGDWENGTISADYFGVFSEQIQKKLGAGDEFVGMMSNGTSGEINIWDFLEPDRYPTQFLAKSQLIGTDLAEKVLANLPDVDWQTNPQLVSQYAEVTVGVRKPTPTELDVAKAVVGKTDFERMTASPEDWYPVYAREQVLLHDYPDSVQFPIQAIRIGNGRIGALGGEFFAETGLKLRNALSDTHYFTITIANGYVGYVPPAHELRRGGYETWRCRTSFLEEAAEEAIRTRLLDLLTAKT